MRKLLAFLLLIGIVTYIGMRQMTPLHNKDWQSYYEKTPDAEVVGRTVTLKNVRNWNHNNDEVLSKEWIDEVSINVEDVKKIWFGYSGFSKIPVLGHTFLSFELGDGRVYTLSVEARREEGEEYSAVKGLFNKFELNYGWGTERDYVGVRVFLLHQPIELYPLNLTEAEAQAIFITMAEKTHQIAESPQFYNTILSNCTNELAQAIETKYPDRISYDLAHNLPGLSINHLEQVGLLTILNRQIIPRHQEDLQRAIQETPRDFSAALRQVLANGGK